GDLQPSLHNGRGRGHVGGIFVCGVSIAQAPDSASDSLVQPVPAGAADEDTTYKDAPYVPSSASVVKRMLEVADVSSDDVVYDLGSGDGRIPIMAAKEFGARGVGIEIDSALVANARARAQEAGVEDKVRFRQGDLFNADLQDATVVALYLWPEVNIRLRPKLLHELAPGDRIVSHDFRMGTWTPDREVEVERETGGEEHVYLWVVPDDVPTDLTDVSDELDTLEVDPEVGGSE
ncbi:MAG: class I SAM-dependent methyltransferase, partial [Salinibacter sp.]